MGRPLQVKIPNSKFQITNKFEITITKTILRFGHFHRHDYKYLFVILSDCLGGCYTPPGKFQIPNSKSQTNSKSQ